MGAVKDKLYGLFEKYKTSVFIETGTHLGNGVERAIDIGFEKIHSIEIIPSYYDACLEKFKDYSNVKLYIGSSTNILPEILQDLNERSTFWLDAHVAYPGSPCPILWELSAIKNHKIRNHNILIDDVRDFGTVAHDFITISQVIHTLKAINHDYSIVFESSGIDGNVLVATMDQVPRAEIQ